MRSMYSLLDQRCPNLDTLVMGQSFIFVPELVTNLNDKLSKLNKLVVLKIMYIATDSMLVNIGDICPKLQELSVKGSRHISDAAAVEISLLRRLRVLDIQGTKISGLGCLSIIERVASLEWVHHCPFNCDSDFQIFRTRKEMLDIIKKNYNIRQEGNTAGLQQYLPEEEDTRGYNIKNFWLFNPKTEELQVAPFCPKLEKIRLDFVFQDMNFILDASPLASFSNLHTLDLNFYDNHRNTLLENILKTCGSQLKCLVYNVCASYRSFVVEAGFILTMLPGPLWSVTTSSPLSVLVSPPSPSLATTRAPGCWTRSATASCSGDTLTGSRIPGQLEHPAIHL